MTLAPVGTDPVDAVDTAAGRARAGLGSTRLVCVDGPAGSGKTTLAADLLARWGTRQRVEVVHMDDLYAGWEGLGAGVLQLLDGVLGPLAHGSPGDYRRYDWHADRYDPAVHVVPPCDVLVVEGCGSATRAVDRYGALVVWVEAPDAVRLERGLARDGAGLRDRWLRFMSEENELYERERTRDRAHVLVDGLAWTATVRAHDKEDA